VRTVFFRVIALMIETVHTSETSVYFNDAARRYIPESCHHHTHRCESLKSQIKIYLATVVHATKLFSVNNIGNESKQPSQLEGEKMKGEFY
jgi:hypothetical protein